ncbi:trypsin-like peptidase domain-containing protein [Candidatus Woesearchaeota archaeon]|nr:trypsin-like peptidase domain-containing protein [Candidatus Woesearchaeota archaeon]
MELIQMQAKIAITTLATMVGLATTAVGCGGMSAYARSTMELEKKVSHDLEDIARSVHCVRVSATYEADNENALLKLKKTERKGHGTAFAFAADEQTTYLLTAAHVVEVEEHWTHWLFGSFTLASKSVKLVDNRFDNKEDDDVSVEVFATYPGVDLAVLRAKKKLHVSHAYKTVDSGKLHVAEAAYIVGYPRAVASFVSVGTIGNVKGVPHYNENDLPCLVMVDAEISPGNSGSPLFVRRGDELYFAGMMRGAMAQVSFGIGNACIEGRLPRVGTKTTGPGGLEGSAK